FTVASGLAFEPVAVERTLARDYNQAVLLRFRNNTQTKVTVGAKTLAQFEDLPADVVGPGSADEPVELEPGKAIDLRLVVAATDATQKTYEIPVTAAGAFALARVSVFRPKRDLAFRVVETNPVTLAQTLEIKNNGDTLSDLAVDIAPPNDKEVRLEPAAHHVHLPSGQSLRLVAGPVLYLEFQRLKAELQCRAAGETVRFPLEFQAPKGTRLIGVRLPASGKSPTSDLQEVFFQEMGSAGGATDSTSNSSWYCTNKPKLPCLLMPG